MLIILTIIVTDSGGLNLIFAYITIIEYYYITHPEKKYQITLFAKGYTRSYHKHVRINTQYSKYLQFFMNYEIQNSSLGAATGYM